MTLTSEEEAILVLCIIFVGYPFIIVLTAVGVYLHKIIYEHRFNKRWEQLLKDHEKDDVEALKFQISRDERVSSRVRFKTFWEKSGLSFLWNCSQAFLTFVACYSYVQELYEDPDIPTPFYVLEAFLSIAFLLDMFLLYYLAADRVGHLLSFFPFFDWISVIPYFFFWGYGNPFLTGDPTNSVLFLRSLRIFRAFRIVRLYRLIPIVVDRDIVKVRILQIIVMVCGLVYVAVGAMQFFEDNLEPISGLSSNHPFPWHTSLYFMIVTLTTVGYGDITPTTNAGRAVIMVFLIWSVTLIPFLVGKLSAVMEAVNKFEFVIYRGSENHILVIGDVTGDQLGLFLREWFHDDAHHHSTKVVVVSIKTPDNDLLKCLSSGLGKQMVTYIKGSPLDEYVLVHRAKIHKASYCLILTKESHPCTLTYLAVKSLNKNMRVVVRVLDAMLQAHFPSEPDDIILRPAEIRRTLSASSILVPGAACMLPGLFFSLNEKDMVEVEEGSWKQEFMDSFSNEFYSFPGPPSLNGYTFGQAAILLYKAYRVILVAATVEMKTGSRKRARKMILLNPRASIARIKSGSMLYAIAPDNTFILDLYGVSKWGNPFGSLVSVIPSELNGLGRFQLSKDKEEEDILEESDPGFLTAESSQGYSSLRVTIDPGAVLGGGFGYEIEELTLREDEDQKGKEQKKSLFLAALENWNSKRDVSFYEHVVLGFRSGGGGVKWEDVYMLLDHLRPKNEVVFEPEQYARKNARISEHLLFIGPGEGFLEVVGPLRLYHSKSHPVIVAVMLEEDRNLESAIKVARSFPDIFIVLGNGHDITTAFLCGVDRCSHIIIAPRATARYEEEEEDPYLVDADVVFTVRFVKRYFKLKNKPPPTFQVELFFQDNTRFLEIEETFESAIGLGEGEEQKHDCCCGRCSACKRFLVDVAFCRHYRRWWRKFQTGRESDLPPLEPMVGSGAVFFFSFMLRMIVATFVGNGGVYELLLLFLRRSRFPETLDYSATLRLIEVPDEYVGESFEDMFEAYARLPKPIIIIGLYRTTYEDGREVQYAVANPKPTFLRKEDRVYALLNDQMEDLGVSMYASMG